MDQRVVYFVLPGLCEPESLSATGQRLGLLENRAPGYSAPLPRPPGPQARVTPCSVADRGPGCWAMAFVAGCFQMSWVKMKILLQEPCDTRLSQDFCFDGAGLRTQTGVRPRRLLPPGSVFPLLLWAPRCLPQNSLCLEKSQELPVLFS